MPRNTVSRPVMYPLSSQVGDVRSSWSCMPPHDTKPRMEVSAWFGVGHGPRFGDASLYRGAGACMLRAWEYYSSYSNRHCK